MKRERPWADVLDEVHGLTVTFPAELEEHSRRLMDALGVTVVVVPEREDEG